MTDGLEMYREVKSLEKNIEKIQLELANMQRHLREVLNNMANEYVKKEEEETGKKIGSVKF